MRHTFRFQFLALILLLGCLPSPAQAACVINGNAVTCTGSNSGPLVIPLPNGPDVTVDVSGSNFAGGITVTGIDSTEITNTSTNFNGDISVTGGADFTFTQQGSFGAADLIADNSGANTLIIAAGHAVAGVTFSGDDNEIDNGGTVNGALDLTATTRNHVINRAGAYLNQMTFDAPRNIIDNEGTLNNTLQLTGGGTDVVNNYASGVINGITSNGSASDQVRNDGNINGTVSLGAGRDWYVNLGGSQLGNIDMGDDDDLLYMEGGLVTSPINMGSGDDFAAILDGTLSATFQGGAGEDTLHWAGGTVTAGIDMGDDDDRAFFYDLTQANLATGIQISGGAGADAMTWRNTTGDDVYRYVNWELIELTNGSNMIFSNYSTLRLGDGGTATGALTVDAASKISAGNGTHTVSPFTGGNLVTVANAGHIDLTNGPATTTDRFVINGNYLGQSGTIDLQTYLGADGSPSDQLVIQGNGARAAGVTLLNIVNVGGPGALTTANGIRVIDADFAGGATTDAGSFVLAHPVGAGIFDYRLFQGGIGADAGDNDWYLRSFVNTPPEPVTTLPAPAPPVIPAPLPPAPVDPLPPTTPAMPLPLLPVPVLPPPTPITPTMPVLPPAPPPPPTGPEEPLIRPEIPGYTMAPAMAQQLGLAALDKFHTRHGDEALLQQNTGGWGRVFGQSSTQAWSPAIAGLDFKMAPKFEGNIWGIQLGQDIWGMDRDAGGQDRAGLIYTHAAALGDTIGNTDAQDQVKGGRLALRDDSLGVYWNRIMPESWYVDAVALVSWVGGSVASDRGIGADISGTDYLASLEGGHIVTLGRGWALEPQGQIVWQRIGLNDARDPFSGIDYGAFDVWTGRLGVRMEGHALLDGKPAEPYVDLNLWRSVGGDYGVSFDDKPLTTGLDGTALEFGAGLSARVTQAVSLYGGVKYTGDISGPERRDVGGTLGLRVKW